MIIAAALIEEVALFAIIICALSSSVKTLIHRVELHFTTQQKKKI